MIHLIDYVGEAAVYEHLAEECAELAHVSLKYARCLRGENPVNPNLNKLFVLDDIKEEATDVLILLDEVGLEKVDKKIYAKKMSRMMDRLINGGYIQPKN